MPSVVTDAGQGRFVRQFDAAMTSTYSERSQAAGPLGVTSLVDIPVEQRGNPLVRSDASMPPDVASNAAPFGGRVFTIVLDGLHLDPAYSPQVKSQARQFVERDFAANDLAAVVHIGDPDAGQGLTQANPRLAAGVHRSLY